MKIDNKFELEEIVFLITDSEQCLRIVTSIQISQSQLLYRLACGVSESWHYEFEIATEKNYTI
jgi:hypothetical protein